MPGFDAELYLRLAGERMLLDGSGAEAAPWESPLRSAAEALVVVGAIEEHVAAAVLDDYALAAALRDGEDALYDHASDGSDRGEDAAPLGPRRVVPCDRHVELSGGTLHVRYVSLDDDESSVAVSFVPARSNGARPRRGSVHGVMLSSGPMGGMGPQRVTLVDDRGTTAHAEFRGGGFEDEWRGHLQAERPLAPDTAWIEMDGVRLELGDVSKSVEVSVEALPREDAALRHLWRLAAKPGPFHGRSRALQPAVDALVAAGALASDDSVVAQVQAVRRAMDQDDGPSGRATRHLPEPWRSVIGRRGRAGGPVGTVVIGAVTPEVDGVSVAALSLESTDSSWAVEVEVAPGSALGGQFEEPSASRRPLTWWAADDLGNHYLGEVGDRSGHGERGYGEIEFSPALDPKATRLDLMPTGETERAVIGVPLVWARGRERT